MSGPLASPAMTNTATSTKNVGNTVLSVTFTPTDATDYTTATATVTLAVVNPTPAISVLSPAIANAGATAFTLAVKGSGFKPNSAVYLGTSSLSTTFVSSTEVTAAVPVSAISVAGVSNVTVQTPSSGGGISNGVRFEVDSAGSGTTPPSFTTTSATVAAGHRLPILCSFLQTPPMFQHRASICRLEQPARIPRHRER